MKSLKFLPIYILLFAIPLSSADTTERQSLEAIERAATSFLKNQLGGNNGRLEISLGTIDPRLRLQPCTNELQGFVPQNTPLKGNSLVGIRCVGVNSWHIYLPVQIKITQEILVFAENLRKGHVLTASDLKLKTLDINQVRGTTFSEPKKLVGSRLKRHVTRNEVADSSTACMVCKGDKTLIIAENQSFSIAMQGLALQDGQIGQRVQIENIQTDKIVSGTVVARNKIQVVLL